MTLCAQCGHSLGVGRYCINCGAPITTGQESAPQGDADVRSTAERPAVRDANPAQPANPANRPTQPPPAYAPPPQVRYPLFADEVGSEPLPAALRPDSVDDPGAHAAPRRSSAPWLPILGVAVALVVLLVFGGVLLLGGDDTSDADLADDPAPAVETPAQVDSPEPLEPIETDDAQPPDVTGDVARFAKAKAPVTAPPSRDVSGNAVRYQAFNMVDGVPSTAWRMPGDGSGTVLTFKLREPTDLTTVGLINGYAKRERGYDGYAANRRIKAATWTFDDGSSIRQTFTRTASMQTVPVDGVRTRTVRLEIESVSAPARGNAGRDYTAISDVSFVA